MQVTHTSGGATFESADGKTIYFAPSRGDPTALFRVPTGGGEEKQVVVNLYGYWANFGVTAKGVYYIPGSKPRTIRLLDEKTGKTCVVADLGKNWVDNGITVSPDDSALVFSRWRRRGDLMLVEGFKQARASYFPSIQR